MTKKEKILLILFILAFALSLYLAATSKPIADKRGRESGGALKEKVDLEKMENDYKKDAKLILDDYSRLAVAPNANIGEVEQMENKLLSLTVPAKFKDLHLNLVLAMTKMENFLRTGDAEEKTTSQQMIGQIKTDYDWIN
ncbi:hypothetical protein HY798_03310 [Candidatus Falkowbacteria bacterium]|nr:hypothetical protein [Candidatus Falkowbacteria bacterium]